METDFVIRGVTFHFVSETSPDGIRGQWRCGACRQSGIISNRPGRTETDALVAAKVFAQFHVTAKHPQAKAPGKLR